jgi:hypothetical protein
MAALPSAAGAVLVPGLQIVHTKYVLDCDLEPYFGLPIDECMERINKLCSIPGVYRVRYSGTAPDGTTAGGVFDCRERILTY